VTFSGKEREALRALLKARAAGHGEEGDLSEEGEAWKAAVAASGLEGKELERFREKLMG
jgi:hypothetical protein